MHSHCYRLKTSAHPIIEFCRPPRAVTVRLGGVLVLLAVICSSTDALAQGQGTTNAPVQGTGTAGKLAVWVAPKVIGNAPIVVGTGVEVVTTLSVNPGGPDNATIGSGGIGVTAAGSDIGVWGVTESGNGVVGLTASTNAAGVVGVNNGTTGWGTGVIGSSNGTGVYGESSGNTVGGMGVGGRCLAGSLCVVAVGGTAERIGVYGESTAPDGIGLVASNLAGGRAGEFNGSVTINGQLEVNGTLTKAGGSFKIDHPLAPDTKYLSHSFVESPDMKNIYDGLVILDGKGEATVALPPYFEALNGDYRYQLTCIGAHAEVFIADEVKDGHFRIAGGKPGLKVSWQVTGIRHDAWANANRITVEENKPVELRGLYLNPEAFGLPSTKGIHDAHLASIAKSSRDVGGSSR